MEQSTYNTILVVEDDIELAQWIGTYLESKSFQICTTSHGQEALNILRAQPPALVLLDGMLPDIDGFDVCRAAREFYDGPIIMLTARDEEVDEVVGLEVGADDYLVKPVRARALLARIRNHLRRTESNGISSSNHKIVIGELSINQITREVMLANTLINVSSHEFDLLWILASKAGEVISRSNLVEELRGFDYDGFDRSIDLRVSRLRKKLNDDPDRPKRIKTVWGKGYMLARDGW